MRGIGVLLALVLLAGMFAATSAAATPRSEFIRKGDALCTQVKRELAAITARAGATRNLPQEQQWAAVASIWGDQIRIQKRFVARFRDIGLPANDRRAREIVAGLDRGIVLAERVRKAFATRDTAAIPGALRGYLTFAGSLNRRVVAYGFRVCGR